MTIDQAKSIFHISDLIDLPKAVMDLLEGGREKRDAVYHELLQMHDYNLSYDWFSQIFEEELAQRKKHKQDFTPREVSELVSLLAGQGSTVHEPTAGTGGLIIADWWQRCRKVLPWEAFPSRYMVTLWELSDRAIPILLLNLSIRGMMGYVYHGDVLENTVKQKYILLNRKDDALGFSEIVRANINDIIRKEP